MVSPIGRTKGVTFRGKGNVVLVAAQLDDADGNPTEEYVLLRADEFGRLRTVDAGAVATFLGLTDTPPSYVDQRFLVARVNTGEDALEFVNERPYAQINNTGVTTWGIPGWWFFQTTSTGVLVADRLIYIPMYVERRRTFTQIGVRVQVGAVGAVARLGIYAADFDASGGMTPGALELDAGTVSVAAEGEQTIAISQQLDPGFHFLVVSSDGAPTLEIPAITQAVSCPVTGYGINIFGEHFVLLRVTTIADGSAPLTDPATAPDSRQSMSMCVVQIGESP